MKSQVFDFQLSLDWSLMNIINRLDRLDVQWSSIEQKEGRVLNELKNAATVRSVGASTRIEGSRMTDAEIDIFLQKLDISRLESRDQQEVAGYYDVLEIICQSYESISFTESNIKALHKKLMQYREEDSWHRGDYKQHNNAVEATFPDGNTQVIFRTPEAGIATEAAMRRAVEWYGKDSDIHHLIRTAAVIYEFLTIHPFQDGNGRLSRLLTTLLLLRNGYRWVQYISFEHEIEQRKSEYYRVLRSCQSRRPNEDITEWVLFFLQSLENIYILLMRKLQQQGSSSELSPREKSILTIISAYPGISSGDISGKTAIPLPTVKRTLADLAKRNMIIKHGRGRGTNYTVK